MRNDQTPPPSCGRFSVVLYNTLVLVGIRENGETIQNRVLFMMPYPLIVV